MCVQGTPGRVVVVSSEAHKMGSIDLDDLNWKQRKYSSWGVSAPVVFSSKAP